MQTIKKVFLAVALLFFVVLHIFARNKNRHIIKTIAKEIAANNVYEQTYTIGYFNLKSEQRERFEKLVSIANEKQLLKLASKNKNAVVRLYSFQALKKKTKIIPESLIRKFKNDHTEIITINGCLANKRNINNLAFRSVVPQDDFFKINIMHTKYQ